MNRLQYLLFLSRPAICFPIARSAAEAPAITWGSDPVKPNETAPPGGWLRIFGKCLSLDKQRLSAVVLRTENGYFMMCEPGGTFHDRRGAAHWNDCEAAVRLRGKNFEMTDCDVCASGMGVFSFFAKSGVLVRENSFQDVAQPVADEGSRAPKTSHRP